MAKLPQISAPTPMVSKNKPVDWVFIFKFNADDFPECSGSRPNPGIFGGEPKDYNGRYSLQYVYASSDNPKLKKGNGCLGNSLSDPLGATFAQIYFGDFYYVLWNDQFYGKPIATKPKPWGHSKGAIAWNDKGEGMVLQVSTPSWPGSGSVKHPRPGKLVKGKMTDANENTLGTMKDDDIEVSQHFFATKLNKADVIKVLQGLQNASVVTNTSKPSIVNNGGPSDIQAIVKTLGTKSRSKECTVVKLSNGMKFISKPYHYAVPPWQLVSAKLGGVPLRVASWWANPPIYSTTKGEHISCWNANLGIPGAVEIATTGKWGKQTLGLKGGMGTNYNHAKFGISTNPKLPLCIFGDMNQQGALNPNTDYIGQRCNSSQNGRGGTFYVLENEDLFASMTSLLKGETAPTVAPPPRRKK